MTEWNWAKIKKLEMMSNFKKCDFYYFSKFELSFIFCCSIPFKPTKLSIFVLCLYLKQFENQAKIE
jgi:hypothetical protein